MIKTLTEVLVLAGIVFIVGGMLRLSASFGHKGVEIYATVMTVILIIAIYAFVISALKLEYKE